MNILIYALFAAMPFTQTTIAGHILLVEFVLFLVVLALLFHGGGQTSKKVLMLDFVVALYALFSLASVVVGSDDLYVSARYYRWNVLAPALTYFAVRYLPMSVETLKRGLLFMIPGLLVQAAMFVHYFVTYGERPIGVEGVMFSTITLSVVFAIGTCVLFFLRKQAKSKFTYLTSMLIAGLLFAALIISFTRMAVIAFAMLVPLAGRVWRSPGLRRLSSRAMLAFIGAFILVIMTSSIAFRDVQIEDEKEVQKSVERLYNIDLYIKDLTGRLAFWGRVTEYALEHPIMGTGGAAYTIGTRGGTAFELGSVHNVLVSSLVVGGIPGLALFVLLIAGTYRCMNQVNASDELRRALGKVLWVSYTMLVLIAVTNDVTGGRMLWLFLLMALIARLSLFEGVRDEILQPARRYQFVPIKKRAPSA